MLKDFRNMFLKFIKTLKQKNNQKNNRTLKVRLSINNSVEDTSRLL